MSMLIQNRNLNFDIGQNNYLPSGAKTPKETLSSGLEQLEKLFSGELGGGKQIPEDMKALMEKVAEFMDKHPEIFGKPDGKDTWLSELKEDNTLNGKESKQFGNAIDMMRDAMGGASGPTGGNPAAGEGNSSKFDNALIPTGNGESTLNPSKKNELEDIAKFMDQHPEIFGKPDGKDSWLSELKEDNNLNKGETANFQKAIDLLKDAQGAAGGQSPGAPSQPEAPQSPSTPQAGGNQDLKDLLVPNGKGESFLNPSKKDQLEDVAKFMDQHPEIFGKPDGKDSWLSELKEDNQLNGPETKQFNKAIDLMKDAGAGQTPSTQGTPGAGSPTPAAGAPTEQSPQEGGNLKDALIQTGKGDAYLNPSKGEDIEKIAKFMDQHPEIFGKPDGKDTWLSELKENNHLNAAENKQFSKAIDMMQDAQGTPGQGTPGATQNPGDTPQGNTPGVTGGNGNTELRPGKGPSDYDDMIKDAAEKYNLDPNLIKAVINQESKFDPNAVSPSGCQGLMQLNPATAAEMGGGNLFDPKTNIDLGAKYLKQMLELAGGNVRDALIKYNAGPNAAGGGDNVPTGQDHSAGTYADKIIASMR